MRGVSGPSQEILTPGTTFLRYSIVRRLGAGGMGAVYEAVHSHLKKRVAIKALLANANAAESADLRARFLLEGEAAARIRHPHVVDVYDVGFVDGIAYMVMELLEGEDLGACLRRESRLADDRLADILLPVCSAVFTAHTQGVIHRDLKPANIFLAKVGLGEIHPKVLDFGISKILADPGSTEATAGLTMTGVVLGTPSYMSPEQAHGGMPLDARSDQYSLGVILYQCATGQRPFEAAPTYQVLQRIVGGVFDPPSRWRPDIPAPLEQIILRAMRRDASERFASVAELGRALLPFASPRSRILWEPTFRSEGAEHAPAMAAGEERRPSAVSPLQEPEVAPSSTLATATSAGLSNRARAPLWIVAGAFALIAAALSAGIAALRSGDTEVTTLEPVEAPVATFPVSITVEPREAAIEIDGVPVGKGRFEGQFPRDGRAHALRVSAAGYRPVELSFRDRAPSPSITLERAPSAAPLPKSATKAQPRPVTPPAARPRPAPSSLGTNDAPIIE